MTVEDLLAAIEKMEDEGRLPHPLNELSYEEFENYLINLGVIELVEGEHNAS